jgi:hypothetical protein
MIIEIKDKTKEEKIKGMVVTDNKEINTHPESKEVVAEAAEVAVEAEAEVEEEIEEIMMITTLMVAPDKIEDPAKNTTLLTLIQTTESFMRMM